MTDAIIIYSGKPKTNSWARWMVGRTMRKNQNNLVSVVGKTGSGKTLSALSICEIMSKLDNVPFTIDHVVFSLTELMTLINSGKLVRGSKIVFDEPQISISSKEFQSEANKVFNFLISTFRHRNLSLFFCTPFEGLLDKSTRRMFHATFETMSINPNTQCCRIKPRLVEYSDYKPEAYRKQLIVCYKDEEGYNKSNKLFYWDVPRPSKELEEAYEKKKLEFTTRLNKNIELRLKKLEANGDTLTAEQPIQERKPLTETQERVLRVLAKHNYQESSVILGISIPAIIKNKQLAEKKGYSPEEFKQNESN